MPLTQPQRDKVEAVVADAAEVQASVSLLLGFLSDLVKWADNPSLSLTPTQITNLVGELNTLIDAVNTANTALYAEKI